MSECKAVIPLLRERTMDAKLGGGRSETRLNIQRTSDAVKELEACRIHDCLNLILLLMCNSWE